MSALGLIIVLFVIGFFLVVIEVILIPGTSVAGFLGLGALVGGIYLVFVHYGQMLGLCVLGISLVISALLIWWILKTHTWRRFALNDAVDSRVNVVTADEIHVGDKGVTVSRLAPMGKALFHNEYYEVQADESWVDPQISIEVTKIEGSKIWVKVVDETTTLM